MASEQTLVLIKHDAIQRSLIGKIISRFEDTGLKIAAMKMVWPDHMLADSHYPLDLVWAENIFKKTQEVYKKSGKEMEYKNPEELGKAVQSWLLEFLKEGPVIAFVLEGPHAIEIVRKIIGNTEPRQALPGTIRADFVSVESYSLADKNKRVVRNLVHASDSVETAKREISVWFTEREVHDYKKDLDKHF